MKVVLPLAIDDTMNHGHGPGGRDGRAAAAPGTHGEAAPAPSPASRHQSSSDNPRAPPRRVDHTYRDYSNFPPQDLPPGKVDKPPRNFPSKLHAILSTPEYAHIISWMPHGRAWKIHNKDLLISDVVPKYFVQSKYESFSRQLNGWGFKRLHQSGNDYNAYYHECFLRGLPHLVSLMQRVQANQGKLLPHVEGEPNFYEIDRQFPLPTTEAPMMPYPGHYPPHGPYGSMPPPDGHSSGYHGAGGYASHPGWYPPPPPGGYAPHGSPSRYDNPPPSDRAESQEGLQRPWAPIQEQKEGEDDHWDPIANEVNGGIEESLEPLPITESENPTTTESSEKDSNTGNGDF